MSMWWNWNLCVLLLRLQNSTAAMKNSNKVPQKIKNRTSIWSSNPTSGYIPKRTGSRMWKTCVHSSTIHNSQHVEATQMSTDEWINKQCVTVLQWNIIQLYKGRKSCHILKMDEPSGYYTKWKKAITHTQRQILYDSTHMGFPDGSVGKESTCKAGDPGSVPGLGRPPGEGKGHPLQYSWASLWLNS